MRLVVTALADGAGPVRLRRPDAALPAAIAELDQVAVVQPDGGDLPLLGAGAGRGRVARGHRHHRAVLRVLDS